MLLHTICSIFQGSFSKWYGLIINIVFMLLTLWILRKVCEELFQNRIVTLTVLATYGMSQGFMSTAMYIRMYAILTFWIILSCYLHLKALNKGFMLNKKEYFKLAVVTFLGFYTHYYYVIYAIGLAVVCCIYMVYHKNLKNVAKYILTMLGSATVGIGVWPFAIKHVFLGYRGRGSLQALKQVDVYLLKIKLMLGPVFGPIIGNKIWPFVFAMVVMIVLALLTKKKGLPWTRIVLVVVPIVGYVLLVSQIVPYYTDRYVMCVYPFVCIILMGSVYLSVQMFLELLSKEKSNLFVTWIKRYGSQFVVGILVFTAFLICYNNNFIANMPGYMFPQGQEVVEVPENTDCIFVLPDGDWNESAEESTVLAQCRRVGIVYESNLNVLSSEYEYCAGDYLLIYVQKNMNVDQVIDKIHEIFGTGELKEVSRQNSSCAVRILLTDG